MNGQQTWQEASDDDLAALLAERTHTVLTIQQEMNDPDIRRLRGGDWHCRANKALNLAQLHIRQIQAVQGARTRRRVERTHAEVRERAKDARIQAHDARQPSQHVLFIKTATAMLGKEKMRLIWAEAKRRFPTEPCWENVT